MSLGDNNLPKVTSPKRQFRHAEDTAVQSLEVNQTVISFEVPEGLGRVQNMLEEGVFSVFSCDQLGKIKALPA